MAVFGPSIELHVYESANGTPVASETAYLADTIDAWLAPGEEAWFQHVASILDGVGPVAVEDAPGSVAANGGATQ